MQSATKLSVYTSTSDFSKCAVLRAHRSLLDRKKGPASFRKNLRRSQSFASSLFAFFSLFFCRDSRKANASQIIHTLQLDIKTDYI
ncbi:hypothetical protein ASPSYDRAFT_39828 [Aspergillus sydowii CBS 593.65]|uniref:Uncharacterized protein n=1 Tax=Aspergillus sydowii CBS 593.65 TaxID=1036612 RepID=A0A1L9U047_9EURO|nr:uncharacterized protein ASPSYDRAFT_39828 [Aspergillus sydowii CBS 593.65]OJJ65039.1 hypothetical protein ASPSYDRAFT_39828 [Aspergillus sydowii CBS 593.65]